MRLRVITVTLLGAATAAGVAASVFDAARAAMRTHLSNSRERLRKGKNAHTVQPKKT